MMSSTGAIDDPLVTGTWAMVVVTFLAVLVALFREEIVRLWRHPRLSLRLELGDPDCHKTTMHLVDASGTAMASAESYYFRLWVENVGNRHADKVQILVRSIARLLGDGTYRPLSQFVPMNLAWSNSPRINGKRDAFFDGLSPKIGRHCDLGHILDPRGALPNQWKRAGGVEGETVFEFDFDSIPSTRSDLLAPGTYRIELTIAGANVRPIQRILELNHTGRWSKDQNRMFSNDIGLRILAN